MRGECLTASRRSAGRVHLSPPLGAQVNKAGGSLSISPPLGLTPPGYELPPLRGWQTSRWVSVADPAIRRSGFRA